MNQLDLSQFPKIVPPDDADEIAGRSKSLTTIREAMENLVNLMQAYLSELTAFDDKKKYLGKVEEHLKEREYEITQKERDVAGREEAINREKIYIANEGQALKERAAEAELNKDYLTEINHAKEEYENRKADAINREKILEEKEKSLAVLNALQERLDEQQAVLEKEAAIDAERKRLLDLREERIKIREGRLALDSQE